MARQINQALQYQAAKVLLIFSPSERACRWKRFTKRQKAKGNIPLRGTALLLDERAAYLWTTDYVPQLDTYIGPETPNPLRISVMRSKNPKPDIRTVLADIMCLTMINYNSCNFNDGLPVTVRFARMVGDVLTMGSAKGEERQPFKFYV